MEHIANFTFFYIAIFFKLLLVGAVIAAIVLIVNNRNNNLKRSGKSYRNLTRSQNDRYILGVCGGIAEYFGWNSTLVRLIFVLIGSAAVLPYIIFALILPVSRV